MDPIEIPVFSDHIELPMFAYGFKCSCGVVSMGTREDPALFSDHLRTVSQAGR